MFRRVESAVPAAMVALALLAAAPPAVATAPARDLALQGRRHLDAGEIPEARAAMHAAAEAFVADAGGRSRTPDPELADYLGLGLYNLGVRLNNAGDAPGALDCFADALDVMRLTPRMRDEAFRSRLADSSLSVAGFIVSTGSIDRPIEVYGLLGDLFPEDPRPFIGLGEARLSTGDLPGAEAAFDHAWAARPGSAEALAGKGRVALRIALSGPPADAAPGEAAAETARAVTAAVDLLSKARDLDPSAARERELAAALQKAAPVLGRAGLAAEAAERLKEAESSLRRAVAVDPGSPWARMDLATFVFRARRYEEAASLFAQAGAAFHRMGQARPEDRNAAVWASAEASCRENRATAMYNLAVDALNRAEFARIEGYLAEVCPVSPRWESTCEAFRGAAAVRQRFFEKAVAAHEEALAAEPGRAADLLALGDLYADVGAWEKARTYYMRLRAMHSDVPGLADRLASVAAPKQAAVSTRVVEVSRGRVQVSYAGEDPGPGFDTAVKAAWLRVETALGRDALNGDLPILVYPNARSFREEAGYRVGSRVKGYYGGGRISVFITPSTTTVEWVSILTHEMAHHAIERLSDGAAPWWLAEGLARYIEGDAAIVDRPRLKHRLEAGALGPLSGLDDRMDKAWNDPEVYTDARDMALLAVEEMSRRGGIDAIRSLLAALAAADPAAPIDAPVRRVFGASLGDIDAAWRAALES